MAYGLNTAPNAVKQATISSAIEDFDPVIGRAAGYAERLQKLHSRVHGPRPEAVGSDQTAPSPQSLISSLNERRSRLVSILDEMESVIGGLENGI